MAYAPRVRPVAPLLLAGLTLGTGLGCAGRATEPAARGSATGSGGGDAAVAPETGDAEAPADAGAGTSERHARRSAPSRGRADPWGERGPDGDDGRSPPLRSVGGAPRVLRARAELDDVADLVPPTFDFGRYAVAVLPGVGRPPCCESAQVAAEPVAVGPRSAPGPRVVGKRLVLTHVRHAPGTRAAYERGAWRTPGARLVRVPRYVTDVESVVVDGLPMP